MTTLSARQIGRYAYAAGFRGDNLAIAIAVALGESSGRVEVVNSIGCVGLWQINQPVHVAAHPSWTRSWLQQAGNNAKAAFTLSGGGKHFGPWVVYTNGSYKRFMATARTAAASAASSGSGSGPKFHGSSGGGGADASPQATGHVDPSKFPKPPPARQIEDDPDPRIRLGRLYLHGGKLHENIADAVTDATLSWSTSEVTQLALTLADPGFDLYRSGYFEQGQALLYREKKDDYLPGFDLSLRIASITLDGGSAGTGGMTVAARAESVWKLKRRRGAKVMRKASPTEFVEAECKAAGVKCVAQPSAQRAHVSRDVAGKGAEEATGSNRPSSWTTFQRLAQELGYLCFEYADTVYFGKPTWLVNRDDTPTQIALPLDGAPEVWMAREMPSITMSEDSDVPVDVSGIQIEKSRLRECRPGRAVQIRGLPPLSYRPLLCTSMSVPLLGNGPIELAAATAVNPDPQPPPKPAKRGKFDDSAPGDGSSATQAGTSGKSAATFVSIAVSASNARYVFGAEASSSDPTPSALDCSELVQWALGRMGIPFVDGSSAQYAACHKITVERALQTRGALLHKDGHIGISMGDGRSVEARNPSDGVGIFRAYDIIWTGGGLVPALKYG